MTGKQITVLAYLGNPGQEEDVTPAPTPGVEVTPTLEPTATSGSTPQLTPAPEPSEKLSLLEERASEAIAILDRGDVRGFYECLAPSIREACPYSEWVTMGTGQSQEELLVGMYEWMELSVDRVTEDGVVWMLAKPPAPWEVEGEMGPEPIPIQWAIEEGAWWVVDSEWLEGC